MKKFNKSLAITQILSLCLTLAAPVDAKSKVKLNITKATLSIGGSINLKLLNNKKKVTWKSSNKKVASVTKKGKVKAKKKGKASIVAKVGKKKYTCKVTVGSASKKRASKKNTKNVKKTAVPTATQNQKPPVPTMPPIPTKTPLIPSTAEFVEKEITMKVGETYKLEVNLVRGTLYHSPSTGFISKNEKVATVENVTTNDNHACVVTAVSEGTTQIRFLSGAPECYCTITVISADDDTK